MNLKSSLVTILCDLHHTLVTHLSGMKEMTIIGQQLRISKDKLFSMSENNIPPDGAP